MNEAENLMKGSVNKEHFFIFHDALLLMTSKLKINWMRHNSYLHRWFLHLNGLQYETPYASRPVSNIHEFIPLYNLINLDILHSLIIHVVLSCYILYGEATDEEERNMCFSYSKPREISWGLKRIRYLKMGGTPSSDKIIEDVDRALGALEIVFHENGTAVEGIADRNVNTRKEVGEG